MCRVACFLANHIVRAASCGHNAPLAWQVVLCGRCSVWCGSVVRGISFFVAGVVFGRLLCLQLPLSAMARLRAAMLLSPFVPFRMAGEILVDVATCPLSTCRAFHCCITLSILYSTPHSTLHTLHCTVDIPHPQSIPYKTLQSTLYTPHFALYTPHTCISCMVGWEGTGFVAWNLEV